MTHHWIKVLALSAGVLATGCATRGTESVAGLSRIDHIVIIYAENHSFDNMYGMFPGANGVANAHARVQTCIGILKNHLHALAVLSGRRGPNFHQVLAG